MYDSDLMVSKNQEIVYIVGLETVLIYHFM